MSDKVNSFGLKWTQIITGYLVLVFVALSLEFKTKLYDNIQQIIDVVDEVNIF